MVEYEAVRSDDYGRHQRDQAHTGIYCSPERLGKEREELKIFCVYCEKDMGEKGGQGIEGDTTSICRQCWKEHHSQWPYPADEHKDGNGNTSRTMERLQRYKRGSQ